MTKTTRTTSGSSTIGRRRALFSLAAAAGSAALVRAGKKDEPEENATVAGTVFRDPGFAFPEVSVTLALQGDSKAQKIKVKSQKTTTTARGEFAFRVPAVAATYTVKATMSGYKPEQKDVIVAGAERVEVTLTLLRESK